MKQFATLNHSILFLRLFSLPRVLSSADYWPLCSSLLAGKPVVKSAVYTELYIRCCVHKLHVSLYVCVDSLIIRVS